MEFVSCFTFVITLIAQNIMAAEVLLPVITSNSSLPTYLKRHSVIYDGSESVFILGGHNGEFDTKVILHYNITNSGVTEVGKMPDIGLDGQVQFDKNGNIFYFGGGYKYTNIYKFNPKTRNSESVASLPFEIPSSASIKYNENEVLIFGGYKTKTNCKTILSFNLNTLETSIFGYVSRSICVSIVVKYGENEAFINRNIHTGGQIFILNLETFQARSVTESLPKMDEFAMFVNDRSFIYIISAFRGKPNFPSNGIIKFDKDNYNLSYVPLRGYLSSPKEFYHHAPASVFVEGLNRIYLFGGFYAHDEDSRFGVYPRKISYIDLQVTNYKEEQLFKPHVMQMLDWNWSPRNFTKNSTKNALHVDRNWIASNTTNESDTIVGNKTNAQDSKPGESSGLGNTWTVFVTIPLCIAVVYVTIYFLRRNKNKLETNNSNPTSNETRETVESFEIKEIYSPKVEETLVVDLRIWKSQQNLQLISPNPIGTGSFAKVYKARDSVQEDSLFAVKKIKVYKALQQMQWDLTKVLREVGNLSEIINPNVVRMWNWWIEDNNGNMIVGNAEEELQFHEWSSHQNHFLFLQMELCDFTLRDWLMENETLEKRMEQNVRGIMSQIVNGLRGIHNIGIIHRDIKPNNIFYVQAENRWKIGDLGLSTKVAESPDDEHTVTGCPLYRSPEIYSDDSATLSYKTSVYDCKSDVFSLGLTFFEILYVFQSQPVKLRMFERIRNRKDETTLKTIAVFEQIIPSEMVELVSEMLTINANKRIDIFDIVFDKLLL